jgi:hypothetical protein
MNLKFSIESWSAWSESKPEKKDWQAWANGQYFSADLSEPDVNFVPAMKRRRMSRLSKMVFATANDCVHELQVKPLCIFASRHGELTRTLKIIQAIVSGGDVSPTDFSMSVHNTALGLFSIFKENPQPSSMVVAGEVTFGAALLEAHTYLQRFPDVPVLLVYADEPVPLPLVSPDGQPGEALCVALLLKTNPSPDFMMTYTASANVFTPGLNLACKFLSFYLGEKSTLTVNTQRAIWGWTKL